MKVRELIAELSKMPQDAEMVFNIDGSVDEKYVIQDDTERFGTVTIYGQ